MTRGQNLFWLAHVCHIAAPAVDDLKLGDFAQYLSGISQWKAARQKQGDSQ